MKVRLAETQVQTAKASELRLSTEMTQLRNEIARQGALLESVQRIEASLSAKSEESKEKMMEDSLRLEQILSSERSKHSLEIENFNGRIRELELDLKNVESKKDEALTAVIEAKKEGLANATTVQELRLKCSGLEAELRSAKRMLGTEDIEAENVEITLQGKVISLTTDLEAARAELTTAKERVATYQKLAKTNEDALAELSKATEDYKKAHVEEMDSLKHQVEEMKKEAGAKQQLIVELTDDLANQRGEQEKALAELKAQVVALEAEAENLKKDAEVADSRVAAMTADVASYRADALTAQVRQCLLLGHTFQSKCPSSQMGLHSIE